MENLIKINENKVDSTGVKLWPAEEIMAYFIEKNKENFLNKNKVLELGAGYSGLAGLFLSKLKLKSN